MLLLVFLCLSGLWGAKYRWKNTDGDNIWTNYKNWEWANIGSGDWNSIADSSADIPGQNKNGVDNTTGTVYLNTDDYSTNDIVIYVTENITLTNLYIESDIGKSVKLVLSERVTATITNLVLGSTSALAEPVNFIISGEGTLSVTENIRSKNNSTTTISLEDGATLGAKSIINEKKDYGATVAVGGDGTGTVWLPHQNDSPDSTISISETDVITSTASELPVDTSEYYWNGDTSSDGRIWTRPANWKTSDGKPVKHYPGYKDGDTAFFTNMSGIADAGKQRYGVEGFTVADESFVIIIKNNDTTNQLSLNSTASAYVIPKELHCYGKILLWGIAELKNLFVKSGTTQIGSNLSLSEKLTISSGTGNSVWHSGGELSIKDFDCSGSYLGAEGSFIASGDIINNGQIDFKGETVTIKGSFSGSTAGRTMISMKTVIVSGVTSESIGSITFTSTASGCQLEDFYVSDSCSITNLSSTPVTLKNVTLPDAAKDVVFTGDFNISGGTFKASSQGTYFINGNVDFSGCTGFNNNAGTGQGASVFFYNKISDTKTFTTVSGMEFCNFYFGGNVIIALNGAVKSVYKFVMGFDSNASSEIKTAYSQESSFDATLDGGTSGSLEITNSGGTIDISRMTDGTGVTGNLIVNADVKTPSFIQQSGTSVTINEGKTLETTVGDYRGSASSGPVQPKNTITVNGTLKIKGSLGAGQKNEVEILVSSTGSIEAAQSFYFNFGGAGDEKARKLTVESGGTVSVGKNLTQATLIDNAGTITVTDSVTDTDKTNASEAKLGTFRIKNSGTLSVTNSIIDVDEIRNEDGTLTCPSIDVKEIFNSNDIFTRTLKADLLKSGEETAPEGTVYFQKLGSSPASGAINISETSSWFNHIEIEYGVLLKLDSDISLYGNWTNNGSLNANSKTVTIKGSSTLTGDTTFYNLSDEADGTTLTVSDTQTVSNKLNIKGVSSSSRIVLSGTGLFVVSKANFTGEYLTIGAAIEIAENASTVVNGVFPAKYSVAQGTTTYSTIYQNGWKFDGRVFYWTGAKNSSVSDLDNWLDGILPDIVSGTSIVTYAETVTHQPVLDYPVKIGHLTIPEGNTLSLNGQSLEITGITDELPSDVSYDTTYAFVNNGTVLATGDTAETVTIISAAESDANTAKVNENGTWHYTASGTVKKIANLKYKNLVISGSGVSIESGYTVEASDGITLGTDTESAVITGSAHFGSPVTLVNTATIGGMNADYTVTFDDTVDGEFTLTVMGGYVFFQKDVGGTEPLSQINCMILGSPETDYMLSVCGASVKTSGNQIYAGSVQLYGSDKSSASSSGDSAFISTDGNIEFRSLVFNDGRSGAVNHSLTVEAEKGSVKFEKAAGSVSASSPALLELSVKASSITIGDSIKTTGKQTYEGQVTFTGSSGSTLTSSADKEIDFKSDLTIDSGKTLSFSNGSDEDVSVTVGGNWTNSNTTGGFTANGGRVRFTGIDVMVSGNNTFYAVESDTPSQTLTFSDGNTFTDLSVTGAGSTLTFGDSKTQTVNGNLTLKGADGNLLTLTSNDSSTIVADKTKLTAEYLSIGTKIKIKESTAADVEKGSHKAYSGTDKTSVPQGTFEPDSSEENLAYMELYKNGWDLGWIFIYTWKGLTSSDWNDDSNWDLGLAPGLASNNTAGVRVIIPGGIVTPAKYPLVSTDDISVHSLTIGEEGTYDAHLTLSGATSPEPKITVTGSDAAGNPLLINNGVITYEGSGRITDGTNPINDVEHGTVEYSYSGSASQTVTHFYSDPSDLLGSKPDYCNLMITGQNVVTEEPIVVGGSLNVTQLSSDNTRSGSLHVKKDLALKSDFYVGTGCTFTTESDTTIIFAGSSEQSVTTDSTATSSQPSNLEIAGGSSIKVAGDFEISGNWINHNTTGGFEATDGTITFTGNDVTVTGNNIFYDVKSTTASQKIKFEGQNTFHDAAFTASGSEITFDKTNNFNSATFTGNNSKLFFSDSNTFSSLDFEGSGLVVYFAHGKEHKVTDSFSSKGTSSTAKILLTTDSEAESPSAASVTDEDTWWILDMPESAGKAIPQSDFVNTDIAYSKSKYDIVHEWASSVDEKIEDSTLNWFSSVYYWVGGSGSSGSQWNTATNWRHKDSSGNYYNVRRSPTYNTKRNTIIVANESGNKGLVLDKGYPAGKTYSAKKIIINEDSTLDLNGCFIELDTSDSANSPEFVNNGTVRLYGAVKYKVGTDPSSGYVYQIPLDVKTSNGNGSTVEYYEEVYGTDSDGKSLWSKFAYLAWGVEYENLVFGEGVIIPADYGNAQEIKIDGSTQIINGSGVQTDSEGNPLPNEISITVRTNNEISVGDDSGHKGGRVILDSSGKLILGLVLCDSLEMKCPSTFNKAVESPVIFSGSGKSLEGNNTFNDSATFTADTNITGNNTFRHLICKTPGVTLNFTDATTQNVEKVTVCGTSENMITLSGSGEWSINPSDVSKISLAHTVIKNSKNTATEPIIVYAKNGFNTDGTGNTNWIFAGHEYLWTALDAAEPTEWNKSANWSPASVPGRYADVKINALSSNKYPVLSADLFLDKGETSFVLDEDGDGTDEINDTVASSLTIGENAVFDFNGHNLTLNTLLNNGRIRVKGSETVISSDSNTGIANLPLDSSSYLTGLYEYYSDFASALNWVSESSSKFNALEFTNGAKGSESRSICVRERLLIKNGSTNVLSLTGQNIFEKGVKIDSDSSVTGGKIELSGKDSLDGAMALSGNESKIIQCDSLKVHSASKFEDDITLDVPSVSFGADVTGSGVIDFKGSLSSFGAGSVNVAGKYILASGSASRSIEAKDTSSLNFASDVFFDVDSSASVSLLSDLSWTDTLCVFSGKLTSGAVNISGKNLLLFGSRYNADDPRYAEADSRFAYYGYDSLLYKPASGFNAQLATTGTKISLTGNLYVNGTNLSSCAFVLPNQENSNPVFNASVAVTERQWGLPYAVVFNSSVTGCSASALSGKAFIASSASQNVTDGNGNQGFQFAVPELAAAYSVSDSAVCIKFNMSLENSGGEVSSVMALVSSPESGGIFYNKKALAFDGKLYTQFDGEVCSVPLAESALAHTDIPAMTPLYLKAFKPENRWNTDATSSSSGGNESTNRSGTHCSVTTDLSFFEGLFFAAEGKTMCRNYGSGLWKEEGSDYKESESFATIDKARPVLIDVFTGQERHTKNTGEASSQKLYDSHNFIEFRYSEPVDIGNLPAAGSSTLQAQASFVSAEEHGGAIVNAETGDGLTVTGFASFESGEVTAGIKTATSEGFTGQTDTALPHSLYRTFSLTSNEGEKNQPYRLRLSLAGYVDEENPVTIDGSVFNNWPGYIDSSKTPEGLVTPLANSFITDLAKDESGNLLKNQLDSVNSSRKVIVNQSVPSSDTSLYGSWDTLHPVFATYVTNFDDSESETSWNNGDSDSRQYEMLGTVDSNTNAYIDKIEMHLFDNSQTYTSSDDYKWAAQKGWLDGSGTNVIEGFSAPETSGGSRALPLSSSMTLGGIRRSSLENADKAFSYKYSLDAFESASRSFAESEISQHVKSPLFRSEELSETYTENDSPYLGLFINSEDSRLPIRTSFTITYEPSKSFITDLAGNRLIQTDKDSDKKILHTIDITPPSFMMTIAPVGEDKIYAVFTKPLAYKGKYINDLGSQLNPLLEKIASNIEFVYSEEDSVDTDSLLSGDNAISVVRAELVSKTTDFTALLFTLDRSVSLTDVEKVWLRVNDSGELTETLFGKITASFIQDRYGNPVPSHTCHALSDFAVNAVNLLYAYADSTNDDNWDEKGIYGEGLASDSSDYAVHDFSADGKNYNRLRCGRDIVFQYEFFDSKNKNEKTGLLNGESLELVYDEASRIAPQWKGDKYNLFTGSEWRVWLDKSFDSFASACNSHPLSESLDGDGLVFEKLEKSEILNNMIWKKDFFNLSAGKEYQFFFKLLDSSGKVIEINHDGDKRTQKIPLYALRMPAERITAGDFSFVDLWSISVTDMTRQRGGVTILNNVINAAAGEKTAVEVEMKENGNLNVYVMTLDGNIIKRLSKGSVKAGTHYYYWDGKNGAGNPVARGLYFVRVSAPGIDETRKVMVVK